jgi:hypothetical protein
MNYRRMVVFSVLVFLALLVPGVILAAVLGLKPLLFGQTPSEAGVSFRLIDHVATGVAVSGAYAWLLWPVARRLLAHVVIVFVAVEVVQWVVGLLLGDSITDAFAWQAFLFDALYAAVGLALVIGWRWGRLRPKADIHGVDPAASQPGAP